MQFSNTTDKNGLIQYCELVTEHADAGISGNATKLRHFTMLLNQAEKKVFGWIWQVQRMWNVDDTTNLSDNKFGVGTTTLVDNVRDYTIPVGSMARLTSVEVMNNAGDYSELKYQKGGFKVDKDQRWQEDAGLPRVYYMRGNSLILDPIVKASEVTLLKGLRIWVDRRFNLFVHGDTTQTPAFDENFHEVLGDLVCEVWLSATKKTSQAKACRDRVYGDKQNIGYKRQIENFYINRNYDDQAVLESDIKSDMFE